LYADAKTQQEINSVNSGTIDNKETNKVEALLLHESQNEVNHASSGNEMSPAVRDS
jgi:hypothetical protein